jgi:hypothetical protein
LGGGRGVKRKGEEEEEEEEEAMLREGLGMAGSQQ